MAESDPEQAPWLTLAEAGRRTGRHPDALRAMIRRGKLEGRKGNAGQWLVRISTGLLAESDSADVDDGPDMAESLAELRQEVIEARVAAARTEAERDSALALLAESRATRERERSDAQAILEREQERADRLAAELAEARRPLLLRLVEALRRRPN